MAVKLNEMNLENVADWPQWVKASVAILICIVVSVAGFWFYAKTTLDQLSRLEQQETQLKASVVLKLKQAASLPEYQKQMEDLKKVFASMLSQLPNSKEVPQLVDDITDIGIQSGLTFRLIRPMSEKIESFYATLPIEISVIGTYDELGNFISGVSALSRIVVINDFTIRPLATQADKVQKDSKGNDELSMVINASTYRYIATKSANGKTRGGK